VSFTHPRAPRAPSLARPSVRLVAGLTAILVLATACGSPPSPSPSAVTVAQATDLPVPVATPAPTATVAPTAIPTATPIVLPPTADLTGLDVDPERAHRLPLAVMLDDARRARPQSGFNGASVIYQATADGYETRYLLIFGEGDSREVGPVRSARFYLVQWASELGAAFAHYGGDLRTRTYIAAAPVEMTSVDGMGKGNKAYKRFRSRPAPHNAYTTTSRLRATALGLGAPPELAPTFHRRPFVDPSPVAERGKRQTIRVPYNTNIITYSYDRDRNLYLRSVDGRPHIDAADDKRVSVTNVVVLYQKFRIDTKIERGHSRPDFTTIGSGKALVFREGKVVEATWKKDGDADPTLLLDAAGNEIPLIRGRTFIQVVPVKTKVSYRD
jgi:hypothetical protein